MRVEDRLEDTDSVSCGSGGAGPQGPSAAPGGAAPPRLPAGCAPGPPPPPPRSGGPPPTPPPRGPPPVPPQPAPAPHESRGGLVSWPVPLGPSGAAGAGGSEGSGFEFASRVSVAVQVTEGQDLPLYGQRRDAGDPTDLPAALRDFSARRGRGALDYEAMELLFGWPR